MSNALSNRKSMSNLEARSSFSNVCVDIRPVCRPRETEESGSWAAVFTFTYKTIAQISPAIYRLLPQKQFLTRIRMSKRVCLRVCVCVCVSWQTMTAVLMKVAVSLYPLGWNHRSKFLIVAASSLISSGVQTEMDFAQLRIHHMSVYLFIFFYFFSTLAGLKVLF